MKLAIISQNASTGGMRVNRGLIRGLKQIDPNLDIDMVKLIMTQGL